MVDSWLTRDGIEYKHSANSINASPFTSHWQCGKCGEGADGSAHPTVERALAEARALADKHHRTNHLRGSDAEGS